MSDNYHEEAELAAKFTALIEQADEQKKEELRAEYQREKLKLRFKKHLEAAGGGIFTRITRGRLAGIQSPSGGRDNTKKDFWLDVRRTMKMALIDLQLFIEAAPDDQANQVITRETLEPIVNELLWDIVYRPPKADRAQLYSERAKIADLFIRRGFEYLESMNPSMMTKPHKRAMEEAIDLSRFLLETFKAGCE